MKLYFIVYFYLKTYITITMALPSNLLPSNALRLISEYSKPNTRPNWRESKPLFNIYQLYMGVCLHREDNMLHNIIYRNIKNTNWLDKYWHIRIYGISSCCFKFGITIDDIIKMGVPFASHLYINN